MSRYNSRWVCPGSENYTPSSMVPIVVIRKEERGHDYTWLVVILLFILFLVMLNNHVSNKDDETNKDDEKNKNTPNVPNNSYVEVKYVVESNNEGFRNDPRWWL